MSTPLAGDERTFPEDCIRTGVQERYNRGETIIEFGETEKAFFVVSGRVVLLHTSGMQVAMLGHGDFVGQSALLYANAARFEARTITGTNVVRLAKSDISSIMRDPSARILLSRATSNFIKQLSDNIVLGGKTVKQRVAHWIASASDRNGDAIPVTHEEVAGFLSVRRPGVTVVLHELEGDQLLWCRRGVISVRDRAGLIQIATGRKAVTRNSPPLRFWGSGALDARAE